MSSNPKSSNSTYKGIPIRPIVGAGGNEVWLVDCRGITNLPKSLKRRPSFPSKAAARTHAANMARYRDDHLADLITLKEAVAVRHYMDEARQNSPEGTKIPTVEELLVAGLESLLGDSDNQGAGRLEDEVESFCRAREEAGKVESKQLAEERRNLEEFAAAFSDKTIFTLGDEGRNRELRGRKRIEEYIEQQRTKRNDQPASARTKNKLAKLIEKFWKWVCSRYAGLESNLTLGLASKFPNEQKQHAETHSPEEVRRLFKTAEHSEKHNDLIPYLALAFFSGARVSEIADANNKHRRIPWTNFFDWSELCPVTGGKQFLVKAFTEIDGKRIRTAKANSDSRRVLHPTGLAWLKSYFETLPTTGSIEFTKGRLDKLYEDAGVAKLKDAARHTFCTVMHLLHPQEKEEIFDKCGHSEAVYKTHYRNAHYSTAEAKEYIQILPDEVAESLAA